jgi:hypothetical protein
VAWLRAALALLAVGVVGVVAVSGGSSADPRTPAALPGLPPPFLGTAVVGDGRATAAIDAYGDVVDLRPGPAGRALIDNPAARQAVGTVPAGTGIVPRVRIDGGAALPLWRADSVVQRYLPGTNVVRTVARFGPVRVLIIDAASAGALARTVAVEAPAGVRAAPRFAVNVNAGTSCEQGRGRHRALLVCAVGRGERSVMTKQRGSGAALVALAGGVRSLAARSARVIRAAAARDRSWIATAEPLGAGAPAWARAMYRRSLLTLRALTDRSSGAVAAGARDGWAYVWPRDAGADTLAFAAAGFQPEARRVARFLRGLDLGAAARFRGDGMPVPGRAAQGDAAGWTAVAAHAAGISSPARALPWRDRPDYQEGGPGDYLANALSSSDGSPADVEAAKAFETPRGLVRQIDDPGSGLDSAAAWAVRPFPQPGLWPAARRTLLQIAGGQGRFGIAPSEDWAGGADPWTAPTAWTAWSLAVLGARREALRLLGALRRATTPAGALPERVDAHTGIPRSTTPLAWSHAFAILALRQLWP